MAGYTTGINTTPPLKEVAKGLKASDRKLGAKLGRINKSAAAPIARDAQSRARSRQQVHFAGGIRAKGAATQVAVSISAAQPGTIGSFMGATRWHQFPPWVGTGWEVGGTGGPLAVNPAIHDALPHMLDDYGKAVEEVWTETFDGVK